MSSPFIWIIFPFVVVLSLWFIRRWDKAVKLVGLITTTGLAVLARILPLGAIITLGPWTVKIAETFTVLGRKFSLTAVDQPLITFVYLIGALWFLGTFGLETNSFFIPLGLGMVAVLIAALAVDPFLYAALLIELAVLLSVPMLLPPGEQNRQSVLRYLIFQTLGMLFILFTGWMLTGVETGPADTDLITRSIVMLGLGFGFLLATFPFYTWIPLLAEQVKPYISGFIFVVLPLGVLFFLLNFLNQFSWLRDLPIVFQALRVAGTLMVATGGIMAAFQNHFGHILGYSVITNIGMALIAIGLEKSSGISLFSAQLLPYLIAVWLWVYSYTVLNREGKKLAFSSGTDVLHRYPFAAIGLLLASFSLAGVPFLAGFPFRLSLLVTLARQSSQLAIWVLVGSLGLIMAAGRSLSALSEVRETKGWQINERPVEAVFLTLGILFCLILGWFPQLFLSGLIEVAKAFSNLT